MTALMFLLGSLVGFAIGFPIGYPIRRRIKARQRRAHLDYLRDLVNTLHASNGKDTPLSRALAKRYHERKIEFGMEDHA